MNVPQTMQARNEDKKRNLEALDPNQWWMEKKLDGFRLLVVAGGDGDPAPAGFSRAGNDQLIEARTPHIFAELDELLPGGYTVLDGEMSTADDDFTHVAGVMKSSPEKAVRKQDAKCLEYVVFDVLWWNGVDLRSWTQGERRAYLEAKLPMKSLFVRLTETHPLSRETILEWQAAGGEGAILKNRDAPYVCGKRPLDTWLKIKAIDDADVVVMGFTHGQGKYEGQVGAVQFGQYRKCSGSHCEGGTFDSHHRLDMITTEEPCNVCGGDGVELVMRGQCSGMTDELRLDLTRNWPDFVGRVMVVQHMGIQREGFRHPQFKGFRDDKLPRECEWDM